MKKIKINFRKIGIGLAVGLSIYLLIAVGLIFTADPVFEPLQANFTAPQEDTGVNVEQNYVSVPTSFTVRDGINLFAQRFEENSNTTILLVHGVLGNSSGFNTTAGLLREALKVNVITLDLRGHGQSEGQPGDIDYLDQYADDISDVIEAIRIDQPEGNIILAGHSMGGGIAMRYAMKEEVLAVDAYLLFAPALGYNSPTTRKEMKSEEEYFVQVHVPRIIGLAMLNGLHISTFNHKSVLYFNLPEGTPLSEYSYRSLASTAPEDAALAFQQVDQPLLLLVGEGDESFIVDQFEPLVQENSEGEVYIIEEANHNSIHYDPQSIERIRQWVEKEKLLQSARTL